MTSFTQGADSKAYLALVGDIDRAAQMLDEVAKILPESTYVRFVYTPILHAAIALQKKIQSQRLKSCAFLSPSIWWICRFLTCAGRLT